MPLVLFYNPVYALTARLVCDFLVFHYKSTVTGITKATYLAKIIENLTKFVIFCEVTRLVTQLG